MIIIESSLGFTVYLCSLNSFAGTMTSIIIPSLSFLVIDFYHRIYQSLDSKI